MLKTYIHLYTKGHMGRLNIILPDEVEAKLRMEVGRRMGVKKGNLTVAITEAIEMWLSPRNQR